MTSAVPHSPQNFTAGEFGVPHDGQASASAAPHSPQNLRPGSFSLPHVPQVTRLPSEMDAMTVSQLPCHVKPRWTHSLSCETVSPEREWWLRVPGVLVRPRDVFLALRVTDSDDLDARQEPVLLLVLVAGMAGVLSTSAWDGVLDPGAAGGVTIDWLTFVVLTFVAGALEGAAAYVIVGGALYLGARGMGSLGSARLSRHLLAFSCAPLALSLFVTLPIGLAAFGGDLFRTGGRDAGIGGDVYLAWRLLFVLWSLGLLLYGIRTVYAWTWGRATGAVVLLAVFLAGFAALTTVL